MKNLVFRIADITAVIGGIALGALVLMTCLSIAGRALIPLGLAPVPGDYEIVEAGVAFAIFCFLPWCQLNAGHATVDVFTSALGAKPNRVIVAFWEVIFAIVLIVIAWRLYEGLSDKMRNGQTSMFLQFPIWWAYAASMLGACVAVLSGLWSAWDRVRAAITGHDTRPIGHQETA